MKHDIHSPNIKASTETNIEANTQTNIDEAHITEDAESLLPPAVTLPLTGHHLIEASAGTAASIRHSWAASYLRSNYGGFA